MPSTSTSTDSETYTVADIEAAFRRFRADIIMIAESCKAISREKAEHYAHDAEYLATRGYLKKVDVTLLNNGVEEKAACYKVNENAGSLTTSRPGGVLWPQISGAWLRVTLYYTNAYSADVKAIIVPRLKINWTPSSADTSHASLTRSGGRNYVSAAYGVEREDYA
jgi:hypothetical protein